MDVLRRHVDVQQCTIRTRIPNLTLLPAGRPTRNPLALITDSAFVELVEKARKDYDFVFIDSPPMLPVVDTRFLKKVADFVLFVVRADGDAARGRACDRWASCATSAGWSSTR